MFECKRVIEYFTVECYTDSNIRKSVILKPYINSQPAEKEIKTMTREEFNKLGIVPDLKMIPDAFYRQGNLEALFNSLRQMVFEHIQATTGKSQAELDDRFDKLYEANVSIILDRIAADYKKSENDQSKQSPQ